MKNEKTDIKLKIESQEVLAEAPRRSYEIIRLSRIKYKENSFPFIDLRLFQIQSGENGDILHPTKKGVQFKENDFQKLIGKWTLVPSLLFHKIVLKKAWPQVELSDFSGAVFKAFKTVEIETRRAAGYPSEVIGVKLMRKAFDPEKGPLTDYAVPKSERQALADLFSGAIGLYKNPHSHREVKLEFHEAFEMLLLASHLMNIIDGRTTKQKL